MIAVTATFAAYGAHAFGAGADALPEIGGQMNLVATCDNHNCQNTDMRPWPKLSLLPPSPFAQSALGRTGTHFP